MRRECLDFVIPQHERHLRRILHEWVRHYNAGRPHSSLGPGIPDRGAIHGVQPDPYGEFQPMKVPVISRPILGGLHHEYAWEKTAA